MRFGWWKECEEVSCLSYTGNAINLAETFEKATENYALRPLKERPQRFRNDFALDVYKTFLDHTPCSEHVAIKMIE